METSQIYISEKVKDKKGNYINPATEEKQTKGTELLELVKSSQLETGEISTYDTNLSKILGTQPLTEGDKIKTKNINTDLGKNIQITGLNSETRVLTNGFSTCNIQLSGTWVGTISFEITSNGGDWVAIAGVNAGTNTIVYSTTGNGIFRFNVSGLNAIRCRLSAFTSGTPLINFSLTSGPQWQPFAQNTAGAITTTEAVIDTNLPYIAPSIMYETGFELESARITEPTIAPTQPTTYAQPKYSKYPQKLRRLRTQIGGSEMLPFAQEKHTNYLLVSSPDQARLLEQIYLELVNIRTVLLGDNKIN